MILDLQNESHAYFIGFAQADGNLYRKEGGEKGKFTIEIGTKDKGILLKFKELFESDMHVGISSRSRDTNYGHIESTTITIPSSGFRNEIVKYVPEGRKDDKIEPPEGILFRDYLRGYIDGNGTLGITGEGKAYLSITTNSDKFKEAVIDYIEEKTGYRKNINRNKRDNIYGIVVYNEDAQAIVSDLWYDGCLCLERKRMNALEVMNWVRPEGCKK